MSFFFVIDTWIFYKLCLGTQINVTQFSYGIRAMVRQGSSSSTDSLMDLWCNLSKKLKNSSSAPKVESWLHNSWAKELFIKIAWLIELGVKKNKKVQSAQPYFVFFVWFAGFSKSFTAFATTTSWPLCESTDSFQLPPMEGGYGDSTLFKRDLHSHNEHRNKD